MFLGTKMTTEADLLGTDLADTNKDMKYQSEGTMVTEADLPDTDKPRR